jgi:ankyrin repeat protein
MLNFAAARGHPATNKVILKHGSDLFLTENVSGLTPFVRTLIQTNNIEAAKLLLPPKGSKDKTRLLKSVNSLRFISFNTVLHATLYQRRGLISIDVIEFLVKLKAIDFIVNAANKQNLFETYFIELRDSGDRRDFASFDSRVFEILLDAFHRPDQINMCYRLNNLCVTPLHLAVWRADRRAVEVLLQYHTELDLDAPFNQLTSRGGTAFDMLRRKGARPDPRLRADEAMNSLGEMEAYQGSIAKGISKGGDKKLYVLDQFDGEWPKRWRGDES